MHCIVEKPAVVLVKCNTCAAAILCAFKSIANS